MIDCYANSLIATACSDSWGVFFLSALILPNKILSPSFLTKVTMLIADEKDGMVIFFFEIRYQTIKDIVSTIHSRMYIAE